MCSAKNLFCFPYAVRLLQLLVMPLLIVALLPGVFAASMAHAAGGTAFFMLSPLTYNPANPATKPYFVVHTARGASLLETFRVTNAGTATGTARLYPVDATTGQTSGVVYLSRSSARHDVGAWITLSMQTITLAPQQSRVVSFQLHIPAAARSGDHVGGIVAENVQQTNAVQSRRIQISLERRTVMAVQLNLGAPLIEQLQATSIDIGGANSYQAVLLGLNNTGTVMLKPYGTLQVFDSAGQTRMNTSLKLDTFLPQTAINYPVYVQHKALEVGTYSARLILTYGNNRTLSFNTTFNVTEQQIKQIFGSQALQTPDLGGGPFALLSNWYVLAALFVLVLGASSIMFYWKQRSRSREGKKGQREYAPEVLPSRK